MPQVASCAQDPKCCQWLRRGFENNLISEIHFLALATSLLQSRLGRDGCLCSQRKQGRSQRRRCPHQSCTFSTCSVPEQKHLSNRQGFSSNLRSHVASSASTSAGIEVANLTNWSPGQKVNLLLQNSNDFVIKQMKN